MIAIVDYGVGNLFSLKSSLAAIGAETVVTGDADVIRKADKIILPGVGAFGDAAKKLRDAGVSFQDYDGNNSQTTQTEQIRTAVTKGAKLLAVNIVTTGSLFTATSTGQKRNTHIIGIATARCHFFNLSK